MIVKRINLCALDTGSLTLGYVGENDHTQIRINCASVFADYPAAVVSMTVKAPSGVVYPREVETDGQVVIWTITDSDTASAGNGQIQLTFTEDGTIVKTVIAVTTVRASLVGDNPPPDPITDWIDEAGEALAKLEGITASATQLPAGEDPTAEVEVVDGHYNIALGIPGGDAESIIDDTAGAGDTDKAWSADKLTVEFSTVADDVSELKDDIDGKAPVILQTASGDIVTISDGADGMPLSAVVQINPVQAGSGDPSPENVRPITGWTGANVYRTGKNLSPIAEYENNPSIFWGGDWNVFKAFLNTLPSGTYKISNKYKVVTLPSGGSVMHGPIYVTAMVDGSQTPVNTYSTATDNSPAVGKVYEESTTIIITDVIAGNINHCYTYCDGPTHTGSERGTYNLYDVQLELGSTASAYEPFGAVYPISWQTAAGTVYGGYVDLDARTVTVTHGQIAFSSATGFSDNGVRAGTYQLGALNVQGKQPGLSNFVSNVFSTALSADYKMTGRQTTSTVEFVIPLSDIGVTAEDQSVVRLRAFKAWFDNNSTQLVYELATPITYPLDSVPEILTLLGENHIWSDTGAISVTYPADTKLYVQKELAVSRSLMELIITANHESGMTASKAYSSGDLLIVNGTLYKATTSIANGGALTVGTNVTATTVANELAALA